MTGIHRRRLIGGAGGLAAGMILGSRAGSTQSEVGEDEAIGVARYLSDLEIGGDIGQLYAQMHVDSQRQVPLYVVNYWYQNSFLPLEPEPIEVTGIDYVSWTWDVTGEVYRNVAEISYSQAFRNGETIQDVVRLAEDGTVGPGGTWQWFFGRDRGFVDQQMTLATTEIFPETTSEPPSWAAATFQGTRSTRLEGLPVEYPGEDDASRVTLGSSDAPAESRAYVSGDGREVARVTYIGLAPNLDAVQQIEQRVGLAILAGETEVLAWNLSDESETKHVTYATTDQETGEPVVHTMVGMNRQTRVLWDVSAPTREDVDLLGEALGG